MSETLTSASASTDQSGEESLSVNRVHQGDCIELLASVEAGTVDLAFADPPFNIGYDYDVYDDQQSRDDYLSFCRQWIAGCHRALKDDGSFWLAIGDEYAAELKLLSQDIGFHCRSWVIWYYTFGVNCVRGFSRSHTHLFHFVKDPERFTFNGINPTVRVPSARQLVYADARANPKGRLPDNTWILRPQDAPQLGFSPSHDTWYFARVAGTFKEREGFHGCQMPEQLLGRIVRVSSDPGDLVLDPFGGSGTTLVVAKKLARRYIGFELSEEYVARIQQRLEACQVGDELDGPEDPVRSAPTTNKGKQRSQFRNGRPLIPLDKPTERVIQSAFDDAANKHSAEELLFDPIRNAIFVRTCKEAKLLGDARTWNEFLLKLSQEGRLDGEGKHRKLSWRSIEPACSAAEVAFQLVSVDYSMDLETILATPDAAAEFDAVATTFGGECSEVEYRAAIWNLRRMATSKKTRSAAKKSASDRIDRALPDPQPIESFASGDSEQHVAGVFAVADADSILFVGQSSDIASQIMRMRATDGWKKFALKDVYVWPNDEPSDALVHRCLLVTRFKPWLNAHFLHQPIATALF